MILRFLRRRPRLWAACAALAFVPLALTTVNAAPAHAAFTVIPSNYTYTTTLVKTSAGIISALYQPTTPTPQSDIAVVMFHDTSDLINSTQCLGLAERGFTVICSDPAYDQLGEVDWNDVPVQVGGVVNYAYSVPGVKYVVLFGWSGGGADVAYYQAVAQNGTAYCQNPERLDPCSNSLAGLKPASGVMMLDSIPGLAFQIASDLDPSVPRSDPQGLTSSSNPALSMFNPRNGYVGQDTENNYSQAFLTRYFAGQAQREDALVNLALSDQRKIQSGHAAFSDDLPFALGRVAARPWQLDDAILNHTSQPEILITPSAPQGALSSSITDLDNLGVVDGDVERVTTPPAEQSPVPVSPQADDQFEGTQFAGDIGGDMTVNTFIGTFAIRLDPNFNMTADTITGVDWGSSNTSTIANLQGVTSPVLIMSESGHYYVDLSEMYYLATKSTNKTLAYVWGGSHAFSPCTQCLSPASSYGDTLSETFNYMANWLVTNF